MRATLTFKFDQGQHPTLAAARITVGTITMKGIGDHARLTRMVENQWKEETGEKQDAPADEAAAAETTNEPEAKPENSVLYNAYMRWCMLSVATVDVQVIRHSKKPKELNEETPDEWPWEKSSMVDMGWDKPQGIMDLPFDLFQEWTKQVELMNPGVFGRPLTSTNGAKKKSGLISVT